MTTIIKSETEKINEALEFITGQISQLRGDNKPRVGIICGSGLGKLADLLDEPHGAISYSVIPHFVASTVVGHCGELVFGKKCGVELVCMRGRVHLYEGYSPADCIRPVRVLAALGIQLLIVTNAAGNLNPTFSPGDFMIIRDHISFPALSGDNPLRGAHQNSLGERFVTMNNAYDSKLISTLEKVGKETLSDASTLKKGIYIMVSGPTFETIAEAKLMRLIGGDAAGMSTANEITAAHQLGVKCLAISLLTNNVTLEYKDDCCNGNSSSLNGNTIDDATLHQEVVSMAARRSSEFIKLITAFLLEIKSQLKSEFLPQFNGKNITSKCKITKVVENGTTKQLSSRSG